MKSASLPDKSYNVKEVSEILGLSPQSVLERIWDSKLLAYKDGKEWRVTGKDIEAYRDSLRNKKKSAIEDASEFRSDVPQNLLRGGTTMKVVKTGKNRWFAGFGGFYRVKDSKDLWHWFIWIYDPDDKSKRPTKAVPIVTNPEEAEIVLKYELEQMRKRAFIQKYLPDKMEELSEALGIENSVSNHSPKLEKMLDDWLALYSKPNRKNHANDKSVVKYWTELFGEKRVPDLTQGDIMRHFAKKINEAIEEGKDREKIEKMKSTQSQRGQVLRTVYEWGKKMGDYGVKENPVKGTLPKLKRREKEPLKIEELQALFKKADEFYPHMIPVQIFASVAGGRIGECEALQLRNVNLDEGWIKIVDPKEVDSKIIDIDSECLLYQMFEEIKKNRQKMDKRDFRRDDYDYAFIYWNPRFNGWTKVPVKSHFAEIVRLAGLKGRAYFHLFRHTAGSMANNAGASERAIQAIYGHHSLGMTRHYLHADKEAKVNVIKTAEKQLGIRKLSNGNMALQG
jgi:integrase